jgi:hypothetical protein
MSGILTLAENGGQPLTPAQFDANMLLLETRTDAGWFDLPMEITVPVGAVDIPTWKEFEDGLGAWAFEPNFFNKCRADVHLNHDYKPSTMIYPHVHWTTNQDLAGTVRFGFTWKYARRADSPSGVIRFTPAQTIYIETTLAVGQVAQHNVSESPDGFGIYHPDFEVDGMILCQFFRDGGHVNDTFPGDVFFIKVDAHCETHVMCTPQRFPPFR